MDDDIENFSSLIRNWWDAYNWAVVSYIAVRRDRSETPTLIAGLVGLECALDDSVKTVLPQSLELEHIVASRQIFRVHDNQDTLLNALSEGRLPMVECPSELHPRNGHLSYHFQPNYPHSFSSGPRRPTLYARGISRWDLVQQIKLSTDEIDWELKAADTPFENLNELLVEYGLETSDDCGIMIVASTPAVIRGDSTLDNGVARVRCAIANGLPVEDLKFGYKIIGRGTVERGSHRGSDFEWSDDKGFAIGESCLSVNDAPLVEGFLSYRNIFLHQWWISDPTQHFNARRAAYQAFDPELNVLRDYLSGTTKNPSMDFEVGVAALLTILGFSVSHMGKKATRLQDGPDVLGTTPQGHLAVVECTIGHLNNNDKLSKLALRSNQLKEELTASGHAHLNVQPIIVTPQSRDSISSDLPEAGKRRIIVIAKEDLAVLLDTQTLLPTDADKLLRDATDRLPPETIGMLREPDLGR